MLRHVACASCNGSGVVVVETKALWGLVSKEMPLTCSDCGGKGQSLELATCTFCEGRGLMGNESEVCRPCNGTGRAETFAFIPRDMLNPGLEFHRRCEKCGNTSFRLTSGVKQQKVVKSWDALEELRQVEYQDACDVACTSCDHHYTIPVDPAWHHELDREDYNLLEERGMDLSFLYQIVR